MHVSESGTEHVEFTFFFKRKVITSSPSNKHFYQLVLVQ